MNKKEHELYRQNLAQQIVEYVGTCDPNDIPELEKLAEECDGYGWYDLAESARDIALAIANQEFEVANG